MDQPKKLHLGKKLEDLKDFYKIPSLANKNVMTLAKSASKLLEQAEKFRLDGDQEQAYVFFMKYLGVTDKITSAPEYDKKKSKVIETLGGADSVHKALDKAESLSKSLRERYSLLQKEEQIQSNANIQIERNRNKFKNEVDSVGCLLETQRTSLNAKELHTKINDNNLSILIMDCRPRNEFKASHIIYPHLINVPQEILQTGMSAGKVQDKLDLDSKAMWASRQVKDQVILMDSNSTHLIVGSYISRLHDILKNWDPDVSYRKPIVMLENGFTNFKLFYPMCCTNSNNGPPAQSDFFETNILDEIEYPNISDITMKSDTFPLPSKSRKPGVDRNSKANALRHYEQKDKNELLEEREKVIDKSIRNAKKIMVAETEYEKLRLEQEREAVEDEKKKIAEKKDQFRYQILQLENTNRDYMIENEQLREELEVLKRKESAETGRKVSQQQADSMEEEAAARRIQQKEEEIKNIEEQHKKLALEREKKLEFAREQKRHMKENIDEDGSSKAKMPQIDRTAKPSVPRPAALSDHNQNINVHRDFSPVYGNVKRGLTGLKNLGNTCYMNSIMQCISNTTCLNEYLIEGSYKQHVNRCNKTQGKIVEEVAAVIKSLWTGEYKCIASKNLRYMLGQFESTFSGIEQQDSHEFLTILVDWLHSDLQTMCSNEGGRISDTLPASEKAWLEFTKSKESLISQLFYGQIKSTVKCKRCNKESATYESFSNLSLELPLEGQKCDIEDCLDMYFCGENIRGWNCPTCKSKQDAIKKLDISRLPTILVIHLKRFYADPDMISTIYRKKQNYVAFPLNQLDMASYVARTEMSRNANIRKNYNLYGVSNHYGSMESGHYTAFCRSSVHQKWHKFDDQTVSNLDASNVQSSAAYILFYSSLQDKEPPQSFR